jgi:hypothetical protein
VLDETYRKAGKMDLECFSSTLDLSHTDLMNIIRGYLLEGAQSTNNIKTELYKLNVYPIKNGLNHVYKILKGSDAVVYQSVLALGYEPALYVNYNKRNIMIDKVVDFSKWMGAFCSQQGPQIEDVVYLEGGVPAYAEGTQLENDRFLGVEIREGVEWVTPVTEFNRQTDAVTIGYAGNEPAMDWAYGDVCLVVRVGKAGDRLAYPTVAQVERAYQESDIWDELRNSYHYGGTYL